jgi:hypothetical protein
MVLTMFSRVITGTAITLASLAILAGPAAASEAQVRAHSSAKIADYSIHMDSNRATGWVQDTVTDGYCVRVVLLWRDVGDVDYSGTSCGARVYFNRKPGDNPYYTSRDYTWAIQRI